MPETRPGFKFGYRRAVWCLAEVGGVGGVVERTEHAGHVLHGRTLHPSLAEWPCRLALKIDDHEVLTGVKHLSQVIVAVDARAQRVDGPIQQGVEARCDLFLQAKYLARIGLAGLRQSIEPRPQELHDLIRQFPHAPAHCILAVGRERFGGKDGICRV